ncbi:RIP metalloprotease RseP [Nereida sp. MMG025]|uniref:RIP metalloprotease RseP n=1 Tax=Nereida sp. MMG025 TaxID=2909981 RepID=UPI001EFF80C7|nr:RIP metalloprotease RseP [Nereida sp. MMG025]MCF6443220.1 RIP metalloprotease RseP [Nereida sp. MMG025]
MDLTTLISGFGGVAYTLLAFVVALSIIVAIHEYGHYIVGRWSGIHAEVFSLGFGPVLYSRTDKRGTVWQIAALPFGGYVKFLGDANAASVGGEEGGPTGRNTMTGAPLWARAATVAAGPIFNFILTFLIFSAVVFFNGQTANPLKVDSFPPLPPQVQLELQEGDQLLQIEGLEVSTAEAFGQIIDALPVEPRLDYTVLRDGQEVTVEGPFPYVPLISSIAPRSAAISVNLRVGDVITAIDGAPIYAFSQLQEAVVNSEGSALLLDVWRDGEEMQFTLVPRPRDQPLADGTFERRWMIGIGSGLFFEPATEPLGAFAAMGAGVSQTWGVITSSLDGLKQIITGAISTCNLNGPVGIAQTSAAMASQGTQSFIWFIAVLSTAVGLLNLFPIPVLDGGHLVFHAYEAVTGRKPSDRALQILMAAGLTLLLSLMIFALGNDIFCP